MRKQNGDFFLRAHFFALLYMVYQTMPGHHHHSALMVELEAMFARRPVEDVLDPVAQAMAAIAAETASEVRVQNARPSSRSAMHAIRRSVHAHMCP